MPPQSLFERLSARLPQESLAPVRVYCLDPSTPNTTPCASPAGTLRLRFRLYATPSLCGSASATRGTFPTFACCAFRACCRPYRAVRRALPLYSHDAVRRVGKIGNADIFEPIVARDVTRHRPLDDILSFFGGRAEPMMAQLAEAGKLTLDDVRDWRRRSRNCSLKRKRKRTRKSK